MTPGQIQDFMDAVGEFSDKVDKFANAVALQAEMHGMIAANDERQHQGCQPIYGLHAFKEAVSRYGLEKLAK